MSPKQYIQGVIRNYRGWRLKRLMQKLTPNPIGTRGIDPETGTVRSVKDYTYSLRKNKIEATYVKVTRGPQLQSKKKNYSA